MDETITTSEGPRLNPWQLGMEPPAGVRFEAAVVEGGGAGGEVAAPADPAAGAADPGLEGGAAGAELGTELGAEAEAELANAGLSADEIRQFAREGASEGFREMLAEAERQEIAQREAAQRTAAQQQAAQLPEWDPFNPEVVNAHIGAALNKALGPLMEAISPALDYTETARMEQGKNEAVGILEGFHEELGVFDHDRAILTAARLVNEGHAPEAALEQAAREQAQFEESIRQAGIESYKTAGQALADAGAEPAGGVGAAADAQEPLSGAGARRDYREAARGTLRRQGIGGGVRGPE